jgi:hypothetical protein
MRAAPAQWMKAGSVSLGPDGEDDLHMSNGYPERPIEAVAAAIHGRAAYLR